MTMKPTPQQVRDYLQQRRESKEPPPTPAQVREQLGWNLLKPYSR